MHLLVTKRSVLKRNLIKQLTQIAKFAKNIGNKWRTLRSRPIKLSEIVWQYDKTRPNVLAATKEFFRKRGVELLWQDFNLLDRWVNKEVKMEPRKCSYDTTEEVQENALRLMRDIPEKRCMNELKKLLVSQSIIEANW